MLVGVVEGLLCLAVLWALHRLHRLSARREASDRVLGLFTGGAVLPLMALLFLAQDAASTDGVGPAYGSRLGALLVPVLVFGAWSRRRHRTDTPPPGPRPHAKSRHA